MNEENKNTLQGSASSSVSPEHPSGVVGVGVLEPQMKLNSAIHSEENPQKENTISPVINKESGIQNPSAENQASAPENKLENKDNVAQQQSSIQHPNSPQVQQRQSNLSPTSPPTPNPQLPTSTGQAQGIAPTNHSTPNPQTNSSATKSLSNPQPPTPNPISQQENPSVIKKNQNETNEAKGAKKEDGKQKKKGFFKDIFGTITETLGFSGGKKKEKSPDKNTKKPTSKSSNVITAEDKKQIIEAAKLYRQSMASVKDLIAPSSFDISYDVVRVGGLYAQTFYTYAYPRFLESGWLTPLINFDATMDISMFVYPIDSHQIMNTLRKKVAQMQSTIRMNNQRGMVRDPEVETALQDAEELRDQLQRAEEKFFHYCLYFTIYADEKDKLRHMAKQLENLLAGRMVLTKRADLRPERGFESSVPLMQDNLNIERAINTSPLSSSFPFVSSDLTSNEGILYGINRHNDSLIIFDRFSLENANSVVFAKSGAGKSYLVKLEIIRSMMFDTDVIIIDPENEYEALTHTTGGSYLRISLNSDKRINPFDLPLPPENHDEMPGDLLRSNIINLTGLIKIMVGGKITPEEEAILEKAILHTYAIKGITMETENPGELDPPTMQNLHDVLSEMNGGESLATRLEKYTKGTFAGIFNKKSNVDLHSGLVVFCIRDLEDELRPIAMYIILNYIWTKVRSKLKRRLLIIDEAWNIMQYEDSARFLYGLVKRARKYYLGVTTITQDVEDFVEGKYGKPVITNSSMQILLKQAPSSVDSLAKIFNLTEGEKYLLLNSGVGQGLFFAGDKHVAIQVVASYGEDKIITTNPQAILNQDDKKADFEAS